MLGKTKNLRQVIEKTYEELPIQSDLDLKLRANDIISLTGKKPGAWLKNIQTELVTGVLEGTLKNDKEVLKDYVLTHVKG